MIILTLALIGLLIYLIMKDDGKLPGKSRAQQDPVAILKIRYANGEIDEETYLRILKNLKT